MSTPVEGAYSIFLPLKGPLGITLSFSLISVAPAPKGDEDETLINLLGVHSIGTLVPSIDCFSLLSWQ